MSHDIVYVTLVGASGIDREGLKRILVDDSFEVVASVDRLAAVDRRRSPGPHLVVVDRGGPDASPGDTKALAALCGRLPDVRVAMLSDRFDMQDMLDVFAAGAYGYIVKEIPYSPLVASLRLVAMGEKVMPSHLVRVLTAIEARAAAHDTPCMDNLSEREKEILCCLGRGLPNKEISRRLAISEATVKVHVKTILRKLQVRNRTQAALLAMNAAARRHRTGDEPPPVRLAWNGRAARA